MLVLTVVLIHMEIENAGIDSGPPYGINIENAGIDSGHSPYGINIENAGMTVVLIHMEST